MSLEEDLKARTLALNAGLPANFIVANPDLLGGANLVENALGTRYNSMAFEFRRRSVSGLHFQTSYVLGKAMTSRFLSLRRDSPRAARSRTIGRGSLSRGLTSARCST